MPMKSAVLVRQAKNLAASGAVWMVLAGVAQAHSFSVAIVSDGVGGAEQLQAAVRGFLVASAERDGHSNETADGHLGGLDVFLVPLPAALAADIDGLIGEMPDTFDVAVALGDAAALQGVGGVVATTAVMMPGVLPDPEERTGFGESFRARFGVAPNDAAAQGYNAARRIDLAVRQIGEASQTELLRSALTNTAKGIRW